MLPLWPPSRPWRRWQRTEKYREALAPGKGSLITTSSVDVWRATIGNPAYATSKVGAIHLTDTLGKAWAAKGIRVNGVAPGLVDTKVTMDNPQRRQDGTDGIPAGRLGHPTT